MELLGVPVDVFLLLLLFPVSLEQLTVDVKNVSEGFQLAMGEVVKNQENTKLRDFVIAAEDKVTELKDRLKMAEETFHRAVKFFGEDPRTTNPGPFFSEFDRFITAYKVHVWLLCILNVQYFHRILYSTYVHVSICVYKYTHST